MTTTEAPLTEGTIIRYRPSIFSRGKLTIRITRNVTVDTLENGKTYAVLFGCRVRPNELNVTFGREKVYCVNVDDIEIVKEV